MAEEKRSGASLEELSMTSSSIESPSSSLHPPPPPPPPSQTSNKFITRVSAASFTSPTHLPLIKRRVEQLYEFEAPQFYDFTKQSDPERGHLDEHWFDARRRTPSSPDFHYIARSSSSTFRPKSASGKLYNKGNYSGSTGGLSFMNTPIGKGQHFVFTSASSVDVRSSAVSNPKKGILKKSATTENVSKASSGSFCVFNSDSSLSDPPSTIFKSTQNKLFNNLGSDERKIISGFMSTPLLVVKTPGTATRPTAKQLRDLPKSPLQQVAKKSSALSLFSNSSNSSNDFFIKETSSIEQHEIITNTSSSIKTINETINNTSTLSSCKSTTSLSLIRTSQTKDREHESFQERVKTRLREEQERIESQALIQARKLQKLKAGPTNLPVKSTKPLTIPKGFQLGCDGRAQQRKNNANVKNPQPTTTANAKVFKTQKFVPTVPKSPLFPSKLRAFSIPKRSEESEAASNKENNTNTPSPSPSSNSNTVDIRRKFEFRPPPPQSSKITIPKSPKLSSIHRNRPINKN